jgi:hypothetical protein
MKALMCLAAALALAVGLSFTSTDDANAGGCLSGAPVLQPFSSRRPIRFRSGR